MSIMEGHRCLDDLGRFAIWVMHGPFLVVASIFPQSKSEAQQQAILEPRNRVSIPAQSSQSIFAR